MTDVNFWKSWWLKKVVRNFLRIEFSKFFLNVVWKYIFPKFLPPIFVVQIFCPPIFMTSLRRWLLRSSALAAHLILTISSFEFFPFYLRSTDSLSLVRNVFRIFTSLTIRVLSFLRVSSSPSMSIHHSLRRFQSLLLDVTTTRDNLDKSTNRKKQSDKYYAYQYINRLRRYHIGPSFIIV